MLFNNDGNCGTISIVLTEKMNSDLEGDADFEFDRALRRRRTFRKARFLFRENGEEIDCEGRNKI